MTRRRTRAVVAAIAAFHQVDKLMLDCGHSVLWAHHGGERPKRKVCPVCVGLPE